ncbi:MAG: hypothetical protein K8S20_17120 [Chloroflexi bacterium]|nr:hypothetical protein [Chloroflexota bacterium]
MTRLELDGARFLSTGQLILLREISSLSASLNMPVFLVGGCVRDYFLKTPAKDLDIIVEGDAIRLGEALVEKFGGHLIAHSKFHTAIWELPETPGQATDSIDLITARTESYEHPGALPVVKPASIEDDLQRRDFTINAMAVRLDQDRFGELIDPFDGRLDLEKKRIRILHPRSFLDDPTRIFRAIRYECRYSFEIESGTLELINSESIGVISKISGERIRHELDLILEEVSSLAMIIRAGDLGVFKGIHSKLPLFNKEFVDLLEMDLTLDIPADRVAMGYMLWLLDLPEDAILSIGRRLDFSSELTHSVWAVAQLKKSLPFLVNSKPSIWTYALEKLPLLSIYVVFLVSGERALLNYISLWRHVKPFTTGDVLKSHGLPPGPRYAEILTSLKSAWLDGEVKSEKEEEELLQTLL